MGVEQQDILRCDLCNETNGAEDRDLWMRVGVAEGDKSEDKIVCPRHNYASLETILITARIDLERHERIRGVGF